MVKISGWEKRRVNKRATLRGHVPVAKWTRNYYGKDFGVVEVFKMTSGKGRGNYFVEIWNNGKFVMEAKPSRTKERALRFAINWMRRHPNG